MLKYKEINKIGEFILPRNEQSPKKKNDYNEIANYNANSFFQSTVDRIFQSWNP